MKDLVTVLFVLILGGGGAAGFFYWKDQKARAEEAAYEQAIDDAMNRDIESFSLKPALDAVAPHDGGARLEALRALYADLEQGDRINMGFVHLRGDWPTTYAHVAELHGRQTERTRLAAEVDERFGPGAYELMSDQYAQFVADMPRRAAEREAQSRREAQVFIRAMLEYRRRTGRDPPSGSCVRDGRIVENC
ncbi:MAG: hypothetical protein NT015_04425 [Alphaproteobacteria bacterium]|nr:hypothetical protein [Alphaproteobacteria bacterium]